MNLSRKFSLWSLTLMTIVLAFGSFSVWNLTSLLKSSRAAQAEYSAMDRADGVLGQVGWLRDSLLTADGRIYRDRKFFTPIENEVLEIVRELRLSASVDDGDSAAELKLAQSSLDHLNSALQHTTANPTTLPTGKAIEPANHLSKVHESLTSISQLVPGAARRHVAASSDRVMNRLTWTCIWLLVVIVLSAFVHYQQHRLLVRPLTWLRDDMRVSAAGQYLHTVRERGEKEFKDVASYFNGLAGELHGLYRNMEEKIVTRSKELVKSERLASVGYLAAGVAHEINNPLSVISGYAELAGKGLHRVLTGPGSSNGAEADAEAEAQALSGAMEAQEIIREEAFRCKEITSRLLSLSRGGTDDRKSLYLDEVVKQVVVLTKGLKNYQNREVVLDFQHDTQLEVIANPTEMKQVFLNLTVNALEAAATASGTVTVGGARNGDWVEIYVQDNGKGMSKETLEQIFEPFFTAKRGSGEPGTGLGLSITHAIIESHSGCIRAESDGPGKGSRFTVRLPAREIAGNRRHVETNGSVRRS